MSWSKHLETLNRLTSKLETVYQGRPVTPDEAFDLLFARTLRLRADNGTLFCIGNGASAAISSHFSADMAKNGALHTEVFTDLALLSAISNDMGFENVYAEPFSRRAKAGDMLVAISSSGRSPNILKCVRRAADFHTDVITFSAMDSDNPLRECGFLNFYVPARLYGNAESLHAMLLHYWTDLFLNEEKQEN
ncbi:MAG: Phosphoheptose isomerase 1 [Lentisphaerae bacterium ADurb.Bin242]|nr:MAG: Phosphoheptose isomerase 1 [Lentisphaerae bacterium ADurb.Bin242]